MTAPVKKRSQDVESLIFAAALKLFTEKGYFNTSVQDIQKEANVSIGSIYHYFKNKEAIAMAIYNDLLGHMGTAMVDIRTNHHTTKDRGRAVIEYLFHLADESPNKMHYLLYATHKEFMPEEKSICSSAPFALIREMISEGMENDEIRIMDPVIASACLVGGTLRIIRLDLDSFLTHPILHYLEGTWECSWASIKK